MRIKYKLVSAITITAFIAALSNNFTFALEYTTTYNNNFTIRPSINVTLSSSDLVITDLLPNTSSDSNTIIVNVQSNNVSGYVLNSSVGNSANMSTNLVHNTVSSNVFSSLGYGSSIAELDDLSPSTWGYSYSDQTAANPTWSNYSGLPLYSDTTNIATLKTTNTTSLPTGDNIRFKIAVKASSTQASGEYTNIINFIAVGNPTPVSFYDAFSEAASQPGSTISQLNGYYKMQDMDADICANIENLQTATLIDVRDDNTYTVAKIANACWMTQNLQFSNSTLDSTTSNIASAYTVSNPLVLNWLELKTDSACYYDGGSGKGWINICMHKPDTEDLAPFSDLGYTVKDIGAWYNYAAATAGTVIDYPNSTDAQYDICPSNWRLPSGYGDGKDIDKLIKALGLSPSSFNPIVGGTITSGDRREATLYGDWWSSTAQNNAHRQGLRYNYAENNLVQFTASRYDGKYVRCIAND